MTSYHYLLSDLKQCTFCNKFYPCLQIDQHTDKHIQDSNTPIAKLTNNRYLIQLIRDHSSYSVYGQFCVIKRFIESDLPSKGLFQRKRKSDYFKFLHFMDKIKNAYYAVLFDFNLDSAYRLLISDEFKITMTQLSRCVGQTFELLFGVLIKLLIERMEVNLPETQIPKESSDSDVQQKSFSTNQEMKDAEKAFEEMQDDLHREMMELSKTELSVNSNTLETNRESSDSDVDIRNTHDEMEEAIPRSEWNHITEKQKETSEDRLMDAIKKEQFPESNNNKIWDQSLINQEISACTTNKEVLETYTKIYGDLEQQFTSEALPKEEKNTPILPQEEINSPTSKESQQFVEMDPIRDKVSPKDENPIYSAIHDKIDDKVKASLKDKESRCLQQ